MNMGLKRVHGHINAHELYEKIKGKTIVKVLFIDDNDIKSTQKCLPPPIPALSFLEFLKFTS